MEFWHLGKRYLSTDELARIFTKSYNTLVTAHNIYQICCHYNLKPTYCKYGKESHRLYKIDEDKEDKDGAITFFKASEVESIRTRRTDFMDVLRNAVNSKDQKKGERLARQQQKKPRKASTRKEKPFKMLPLQDIEFHNNPRYVPDESNMDYANNELLNSYQFNESQKMELARLISEAIKKYIRKRNGK